MINIWGMWFLFAMPLLISIVLVHIEGVEEGRKKYARINRVQYRKNNYRNTYAKRPNSTKHYRNR